MKKINKKEKFTSYEKSYEYLINHPIFDGHFLECFTMDIVKVNPLTNKIDDNDIYNTKIEVWLECGPYQKECKTHDINLDCGGKTMEFAFIELANLVRKYYGDDKEKALAKVRKKYN